MDLITNAEKQDSKKVIEDFYKRKMAILEKQNKALKKKALDTSVAGGIINTYLTRGVYRKDFATPLMQSLIAEEMANEGYFSLALNQFIALCRDVEVEVSYKSKELNEDLKHKIVLEFVKKQINNIGGYEAIFEKVIIPALRWGVGIGLPEFQPVGNKIGFKSIRTINMQNIQQFIFDENDTTKLSSIKYITFPKMVNTGLEDLIERENKDADTNMTEVSYITINLSDNCVAYHPHNAIDGDPFGTPYLYFLYSNYKTYKKLTESMYNVLHSFGNYPLGVQRTSRESGVDDLAWENTVSEKLQELMDEGGGVYVDGESQLYNLTPPDTSNMTASMKDIFDTVMRTASLGQITAGIDGGGSRNLTKSMDLMTNAFVLSTIKSAYIDISETMIHNLCYLNFTKDYRLGKLIEYPYIVVKDTASAIDDNKKDIVNKTIDKVEDKEAVSQGKTKTYIIPIAINKENKEKKEVVKQGVLSSVIEQEGNRTTFRIVKQEPNDLEKSLNIDVESLDTLLSKLTDELGDLMNNALRPKMKDALERLAKNPKANLNIWGIFDKNAFTNNVKAEIEHIVRQFALENAKYIDASFNLGNTNFLEQLGMDMSEYADKIASRYMKSEALKTIQNNFIQEATNYVRDYAIKVSSGFNLNSKEARLKGLERALQDVDNLKGVEFEKLAEQTVATTFTNLTEFENKEAVKKAKNKNYVMFRSGILEGQCEHCRSKMGEVYYMSEDGDNYINDKGEYLTLPDPECKGMKYGNKCRCFSILSPKGIIGL